MFKSYLNEISRGRNKSEEQKRALENIKLVYKSREAVVKLFMIILQFYLRLNTKQSMEKGFLLC